MSHVYDYPRPALTADCVVFKGSPDDWSVLLVKRKGEPFKGQWALPGGFAEPNETSEQTIAREVKEETGLAIGWPDFLGLWDTPGRDPRGWVVSAAHWVSVGPEEEPRAGSDAEEAKFVHHLDLPTHLAFDHDSMIRSAFYRWAQWN